MSSNENTPNAKANDTTRTRPFTSKEFIASLRDGREIWIYGERVKDVSTHPAFRNTVRMLARLYDALHDQRNTILCTETDTGNGGYTHKFFKAARNAEEMVGTRDAIAEWARVTYGWMGRSPDYKAAFLATLGANPEFYAPYQENARRWYKKVQEEVTFINHAIVNPPVDRNKELAEVRDVYMHVEKETDAGLIVSREKVVATTSTLTNYNFIANNGALPIKTKDFAFVCIAPTNSPGLKLFCRPSYEMTAGVMGSPFDYPLSSRSMRTTRSWFSIRSLSRGKMSSLMATSRRSITSFRARAFSHVSCFTVARGWRSSLIL